MLAAVLQGAKCRTGPQSKLLLLKGTDGATYYIRDYDETLILFTLMLWVFSFYTPNVWSWPYAHKNSIESDSVTSNVCISKLTLPFFNP